MKISKLAVLVLLAVFIVSLIVLAPARLIYRFLPADNSIQLSNLNGSIWRGKAEQVIYQNRSLGNLDWRLQPSSLFSGKIGSSFLLNHPDYEVDGNLKAGANNLLILNDTIITMDANKLPLEGIASAVEANGVVIAQIESLHFIEQQIDQLEATINWSNASVSAPIELILGEILIDAQGEGGQIKAIIKSSANSQLDINGTIDLDPKLQYSADIKIKSKANTPEEVSGMLPLLGQTDSDGAVRLISNGVIPR